MSAEKTETNNMIPYETYMDFCKKYEQLIESSIDTMNNFIQEIPKDSTLYLSSNVVEETLSNLKSIDYWIKKTKELSKEDFL